MENEKKRRGERGRGGGERMRHTYRERERGGGRGRGREKVSSVVLLQPSIRGTPHFHGVLAVRTESQDPTPAPMGPGCCTGLNKVPHPCLAGCLPHMPGFQSLFFLSSPRASELFTSSDALPL